MSEEKSCATCFFIKDHICQGDWRHCRGFSHWKSAAVQPAAPCSLCEHYEMMPMVEPCITCCAADTMNWPHFVPRVFLKPGGVNIINETPFKTQVGGGHYKDMPIQPVEFIHKNDIPYIEGCVIKYVVRWRSKNGMEDLKKARHFLDMLIEMESSDEGGGTMNK